MPPASYSTLLSRLPPGEMLLRTDRQLMEQFIEQQDQTAFATIVAYAPFSPPIPSGTPPTALLH
jgi:hypothetical protein